MNDGPAKVSEGTAQNSLTIDQSNLSMDSFVWLENGNLSTKEMVRTTMDAVETLMNEGKASVLLKLAQHSLDSSVKLNRTHGVLLQRLGLATINVDGNYEVPELTRDIITSSIKNDGPGMHFGSPLRDEKAWLEICASFFGVSGGYTYTRDDSLQKHREGTVSALIEKAKAALNRAPGDGNRFELFSYSLSQHSIDSISPHDIIAEVSEAVKPICEARQLDLELDSFMGLAIVFAVPRFSDMEDK